MEMRVVLYNEGRFLLSKETEKMTKDTMLNVNIAPVLKYRDDDDVVGALLNIDYSLEGKSVMFIGMVVSIHAENIHELLKEPDENKVKQELKPIWDLALGVARGVLIEKLKGTALESHYLPVVDLDKFAPYAVLAKEPKQAPASVAAG